MKTKLTLIVMLGILLSSCSNKPIFSSDANANNTKIQPVSSEMSGQNLPISALVIMGNEKIELEVTKTPEQQELGLMYRQSLDKNRGMLFTFSPPRKVGFWMKNVIIPLDMVFIQNGKIKAIANNVPPCSVDPCPVYAPETLVDTVIELKNGRAKELGLKIDDSIEIKFLDTPQQK
jgi:hypothetical protein